MLRTYIICMLLLQYFCFPSASAQTNLFDNDIYVYRQFDSIVRKNLAAHPASSVLTELSRSYEMLNDRKNPLLPGIELKASKAGMQPSDILRTIVGVYLWQGLYDSVKADTGMGSILPVASMYNGYLCACMGENRAPDYKLGGKYFATRYDSCKKNISKWSKYAEYRRMIDSSDKLQLQTRSRNQYLAWMLRTCHFLRNTVLNGLPQFEGFSLKERMVVSFNRFQSEMYTAIRGNHLSEIKSYLDAATLKQMQGYLNTIVASLKDKQVMIRMAFYNETGMFYFLAGDDQKGFRVQCLLSYKFEWEDKGYRIISVKYETRKELKDIDAREEDIIRHFFRHPLIPMDEHGFPRHNEVSPPRVVKTTILEDMAGIDATPVF